MSLVVQHEVPEIEEPAAASLRLQSLWGAMLRRWKLLAVVFFGIAALAIAVIALMPPKYSSTATILIRPGLDRRLTEAQSETAGASPTPASLSAAVDSEVELLRSDETARVVVRELGLVEDPEWNRALPRNLLGRHYVTAAATDAAAEAETARTLAKAVQVRRRALSEVVDIRAEARHPARAAEIANAYVEAYLANSVAAENTTTERAAAWLLERLRTLQADLADKEEAVANYRRESGLLVGTGESLTEQQVRSVQENVILARSELAERNARYAHVRSLAENGASPDSTGDALASNVIRDLRNQEAELTSAQAQLETTLGERHPDVINGRQRIADVRSQINAEMQRIAASAEGEVRVAQARLGTLQAALSSAGGQMAGSNQAQVRLAQLMREANAAQVVYDAFLQRYHQVHRQGETAPLQVRVVSQALPADAPVWPDARWAALFAVLLGLSAGALVVIAVEMVSDPVVSADDVERRLGMPILASIPSVPNRALRLLAPDARHPAGYLTDKPLSSYAEAMRVMRTSIRFASHDGSVDVVALTSSRPNEGKTTCALSLARAAALSGQKVILLDCDLRHGTLNQLLNISPLHGLWHVLARSVDWRSVTGEDEASGAHILPSAPGAFASADLLASEAMTSLLEELRANYDLVVLDCPPVWAVADTRVLASLADGVVLVGRWNKTSVSALASAVRHLQPSAARIVGVVVNGVDANMVRRAGYTDAGFGAYADASYYMN
ncbi:MAG: GumC family protein [Hyphomonadaceae bacterium]